MRKAVVAAVMVFVLLFAGCGSATPDDAGHTTQESGGVSVELPGSDGFLTTVTVDGVKCIVAKTSGSVALSCDWADDRVDSLQ